METADIERWYRKYAPMVFRRCRNLLRDESLAEEATQDVFVKVLRNASAMQDEAPSSYLYQAATTVSLNMIRDRRRRPMSGGADLAEQIADASAADDMYSARETLTRFFRRQRPGNALIAALHLLDGMTLEEVAEEVGLSVSGVRRRLGEVQAKMHQIGVKP